ncbi:LEAF RUST 10 DISEASE-RESISTANCE LOCUS RECEPTOR-LIKE PROTEIN KINASE-like 1.1 [Gastrolobium bilobum]|uniref:LEAF RUST 10 DISEASE-RESISTANCE LOCUS RECEPTOR-LIKE PROTEIN KINASE-like 1.1 n=1 Tax=Gastrolobium bilobum TaxID=150636 RepID=UPI002AAF3DD0|nr:LEAF RUST 10 DISEASE-RESISTANCE LOCUS RECEPTOR-LIKE PROTEIN KINASE-like 1.1 [Gastrolobium bilobum]
MAQVDMLCFVLLTNLVVILSGGYQQNCPRSFNCGNIGPFHYPFTKAEQPLCGLLPIHNCDGDYYSPRNIQLEMNGKSKVLNVTGIVLPNKITLLDEDLHQRLKDQTCETLNNNYTLSSPSPLFSVYIKWNVTLFRCKHDLNIKPPVSYLQHKCDDLDFDIYYDGSLSPNYTNEEEVHRFFSSCSALQFPSKDLSDTKDIQSFVSSQMVVEIVLSHDCDECCHHNRGQCRLDTNKSFYCDQEPDSTNLKLLLGLGIGLSFTLLCILIIGYFLKRKHATSDPQHHQSRSTHTDVIDPHSNPDPEDGRVYFGIPLFSYKELEEATNNFHPARQIGSGGFGTVYYGKLRDGREVAVKRLYEHNYRRVEQFINEVEILTRLRHINLVSLYGCTSHHSQELLLVYEYVPNGTVACHLHGDLARSGTLPWHARMKIAIETASSLAYLHASDIIHRDVKTKNLLLTHSFSVKVADFGLSKLLPSDVTHASTAPQGTPGYVDPEYHQCYQLSSKSDVYSFGVVLIELISSKPAVDMSRHRDEINLSNLAIKKIQKSAFSELVDPSLGFDSDKEVKRMIVSVAELAFQCLQMDKEWRPSMNEVLKVLMRIGSGKDKPEHLEEVDLRPPSPPSPDCDEIGLLKKIMLTPSPKAVTDRWDSESTTPNVSGS